jgi:hypothetical protein
LTIITRTIFASEPEYVYVRLPQEERLYQLRPITFGRFHCVGCERTESHDATSHGIHFRRKDSKAKYNQYIHQQYSLVNYIVDV